MSKRIKDSNKELKIKMEKLIQMSHEYKKDNEVNEQVDQFQTINLIDSIQVSNNKQEVSILNKDNEWEIISMTSDKILESIQIQDFIVEVVGFIDYIDGPKSVGKTKNHQLLKFMLNNNSSHRIQVIIWNAEIERVKHHILKNKIIHIDGAKAQKTKLQEYNEGIVPYELVILPSTIINNLGPLNLKETVIQPQLVDLFNISEYLDSYVLIHGYIKTNFNVHSNRSKNIGNGSITDGTHKLAVRITNYEHEVFVEKGQHVEIKGCVKLMNDIFYLEVDKMSDIKLLGNKKLSFQEILMGARPIMKRSSEDDLTLPPNKFVKNS